MHGCNGKMGQVIGGLMALRYGTGGRNRCQGSGHNPYPVFTDIANAMWAIDCIIDFSAAVAVDIVKLLREKKSPACCTTGLSRHSAGEVNEAAKVAILKSANMSLGINLMLKLLKEAAGVLAPAGFDIEIVEKHHNLKLDAPSGTALALADSINEEFDNEYEYVYDRSTRRERRPKKEIGISAVRGGTIVGDHDVIFAGADEVVTFSHTAYSKAVFGKGAVQAAKFLAGKPAGMYNMSDVIDAAM